MKKEELLHMVNIKKSFGPVQAIREGHLRLRAGEIHGLMGENGAGKSTLMNVLSGTYSQNSGDIILNGEKVVFHHPTQAREEGIVKIHQELQLVPELTVAENVFLGREPLTRNKVIDYKKMNKSTKEYLQQLRLDIEPTSQIKNLRIGQQQLVEIAKAITMDVKILIMDEPTSALSKSEANTLFEVVLRLKKQGVSIIYITHRMEEVFQLTDHITVMRDGAYVHEVKTSDTDKDDLVKMMVGRDVGDIFYKRPTKLGGNRLEVKNLNLQFPPHHLKTSLYNINFAVKSGEVLGIAGLMGAGRTELFESLFGLHKNMNGSVEIDGEQMRIKEPKDAIKAGIAFVTENRKEEGLVMDRSIGENMTLPLLKAFSKRYFMETGKEIKGWKKYFKQLAIKAPSVFSKVSTLSGGNQQKVVLARWLMTQPKVLLLDEPTRGIDVGARGEIYQLINSLAEQGMAIIVVSSELPEIIGISDRIITLCEGRVTGSFVGEDMNQETLLKAATLREEASYAG